MKKTALITGICGQDGSYLADFLIKKDYRVVGVARDVSTKATWRLQYFGIEKTVILVENNITAAGIFDELLNEFRPDEIYNFAGISSVRDAWEKPSETFKTNALAVVDLLEAVRKHAPKTRVCQASSANIFGSESIDGRVTEDMHAFYPIEPYGVAKLAAHLAVQNARRQHGVFAVNGILFNHESPLRHPQFVFKKIVSDVVAVFQGKQKTVTLGDLDAVRDWSFAGDMVIAMWTMLQADTPKDYILCSGTQRTVKDLVRVAFEAVGVADWQQYVQIDEQFFRKKDVMQPKSSPQKIMDELGWKPEYSFEQLVQHMIDYEMEQTS